MAHLGALIRRPARFLGALPAFVPAFVLTLPVFAAEEVVYRVQPGDHLTSITRTHLIGGATQENIRLLAQLNAVRDPNYLEPGRAIRIPRDRLRTVAGAGRVADTYGSATVDGAPAQKGATVGQGARIATGEPGGVLIELADGSKLWVRSGADLTVDSLAEARAFDYRDTAVTVKSGRVETFVDKLRGASRFEIRSPTAKLGVRGTEFRVGADERAARVEVTEGRVGAAGAAAGATAEVPIDAGFGSVVDASGVPQAPTRLLPAPDLGGLPALLERPVVRFRPAPLAGAAAIIGDVADAQTRHIVASRTDTAGELRFDDLADGRYVLAVRGRDGNGLQGFTAEHAFTMKARPEPPFPAAPPERHRTRGETVRLAWAEVPAAETYRLQVARDAGFRDLVVDRADLASNELQAKFPPGEYFWRLAAIARGRDQGPFGDARRFELRPLPGLPPEPAIAADGRPVFSFPAEPGQRFEIQVARDLQFAQLVQTIQTSESTVTLDAQPPGTYYVRVQATDPDGVVGPFTGAQRFRIEPKPLPVWMLFIPLLFLLVL